jgi:hypothetical protein
MFIHITSWIIPFVYDQNNSTLSNGGSMSSLPLSLHSLSERERRVECHVGTHDSEDL